MFPSPPISLSPAVDSKSLYLAPRPAGRSPEAFRRRWRRHGTLAMSLESFDERINRYEMCDTVPTEPRTDGVELASEAGGVGMLWYPADSRREMFARADFAAIYADELPTFGAHVETFSTFVDEHRLAGRHETARFKLFRFLRRVSGVDVERFGRLWREDAASGFEGGCRAHACLVAHDLPHPRMATFSPDVSSSLATVDAVVELGFPTLEAALAGIAAGARASTAIDGIIAVNVLTAVDVLSARAGTGTH